MDIKKLIGDKTAALPPELAPIIDGLIKGEIRSIALVVENQKGEIGDMFCIDMNDGDSNVFAVLGAIESMKRDFMRAHIESRIPYVETEDLSDE